MEPDTYHRELAEKLWDIGLLREVPTIADASLLMIRVADVLADEGVVDPEKARAWDVTQDARLLEREQQLADLRSENERLKSKIAEFIDGENNA